MKANSTLAAVLCLAALACTADTDTKETPTWNGSVGALVARSCGGCHSEGSIAPFSSDYASMRERGALVKQSVVERTMPPMPVNNDGSCHTYSNARWLSDAEVDTLVRWVDAGMPLGDGGAAADFSAPVPQQIENYEVEWVTPEYTPQNGPTDDYRCFILDSGLTTDDFLVAQQTFPGNSAVVHHVTGFAVSDSDLPWAEARDAEDEEPGYSCYGAGAPTSMGITAWAPGSGMIRVPGDAGYRMPASGKVIVQVHYNLSGGIETDPGTRIRVQARKQVAHEAITLSAADFSLRLAPGEASVANNPLHSRSGLAGVTELEPANWTIYGFYPHASDGPHASRDREAGWPRPVRRRRRSVGLQLAGLREYDQPMKFRKEDGPVLLQLNCTFDTRDVNVETFWGEDTTDEMCFAAFVATRDDD
ncbi:MAG: hypothetical protein R3A78_04590 [Polyangiales bacterium]